ncbi:MAG: hypothetical protein GWN87_14130, partial [Desulfuromonadales bacterium]|nr:hypothetical protein [Desulfuromonadales bacterium]
MDPKGKEPQAVSRLGSGSPEEEKPKFSEENATAMVDGFLRYYRIDTTGQNENTSSIRVAREKLIGATMEGRLEFEMRDGDMWVIQTLLKPLTPGSNKIEYRELDGKAKLQMKHNDDNDTHGKIQSLMGGLSKLGGAVMS